MSKNIMEYGRNLTLTEIVKISGALEEQYRRTFCLSDVWANASCLLTGGDELFYHYADNLREARVNLEEHISLCRRILHQLDAFLITVEPKEARIND